jgi:hypothetical protein
VLTILPCPLWFISRWASTGFLLVVFGWSIYNGATFYIDVFGKRFQKELEAMRADVIKWQNSPETLLQSPHMTPHADGPPVQGGTSLDAQLAASPLAPSPMRPTVGKDRTTSLDHIPMLDETSKVGATGVDRGDEAFARERKAFEA